MTIYTNRLIVLTNSINIYISIFPSISINLGQTIFPQMRSSLVFTKLRKKRRQFKFTLRIGTTKRCHLEIYNRTKIWQEILLRKWSKKEYIYIIVNSEAKTLETRKCTNDEQTKIIEVQVINAALILGKLLWQVRKY